MALSIYALQHIFRVAGRIPGFLRAPPDDWRPCAELVDDLDLSLSQALDAAGTDGSGSRREQLLALQGDLRQLAPSLATPRPWRISVVVNDLLEFSKKDLTFRSSWLSVFDRRANALRSHRTVTAWGTVKGSPDRSRKLLGVHSDTPEDAVAATEEALAMFGEADQAPVAGSPPKVPERGESETDERTGDSDLDPLAPTELEKARACEYDHAAQILKGQGKEPTDESAYELLTDVFEREGKKLPSFQTWSRSLRRFRKKTGQQKNLPRTGRADSGGGSVVNRSDL